MMTRLTYAPMEKLLLHRPVDRISFIVAHCRNRSVLDIGCYDETALVKRDTPNWLHGRIAAVASSTLGVDNSSAIPVGGIITGPNSCIRRADATDATFLRTAIEGIDVIVAGEFIEHLQDTLGWFELLRKMCHGRQLIVTTPNMTSVTSVLLAAMRRESCHVDHLQVYSYKTLNTLCLRAGFDAWSIIPYYVRYTEMALRASAFTSVLVRSAERIVNFTEWACPLLAGGLILHVNRI